MAEFQEVMKQKKRMCTKYTGGGICQSKDYNICPLKGHDLCSKTLTLINIDKIQEGEEIIMRWAAENPEPIYPSWYRWLIMMGAIGSVEDLFSDLQREIPADIAQKLGIEPVPVVHGDCGATNETDAWKKLGIEPKEGKPKKRTKDMVCNNDYCELE